MRRPAVPDTVPAPNPVLDRRGFILEFEDDFRDASLDPGRWWPYYLPHWSSRAAAAARYRVAGSALHLAIDADQPPWCPEFDGPVRASSLQTGAYSGPSGSGIGQHRFRRDLVVREEQPAIALYLPHRGLVEARAQAPADPGAMCALWMIGYEDAPERSAEICVFEIFGRDVSADRTVVGMGLHPFADPTIRDDFSRETLPIDGRELHEYAVLWGEAFVAFYCDGRLVRVVDQSPDYPMQLMLSVYDFAEGDDARDRSRYPKEFVVDWVRGYRRA